MSGFGSVSEMGYVALRTRDVRASVKTATELLGLAELGTSGGDVLLSAHSSHPELVYTQSDTDGVDHFGLVAASAEELAAIREKVARGGWSLIADEPIADHASDGFAFVGPEGFAWHVYTQAAAAEERTGTFGPDRYGHINIRATDTIGMRDFLADTFDFRVSDQIGDDVGFFMRCNPDHHGIAIVKSHEAALHHHAWQTQSIADLGRLGDRVRRAGSRLLWGPVRHGAGHNIAAYYVEPAGNVVELYTDLELIWDKEREAVRWEADDLFWINQWDGYVPPEVPSLGVPPVAR